MPVPRLWGGPKPWNCGRAGLSHAIPTSRCPEECNAFYPLLQDAEQRGGQPVRRLSASREPAFRAFPTFSCVRATVNWLWLDEPVNATLWCCRKKICTYRSRRSPSTNRV